MYLVTDEGFYSCKLDAEDPSQVCVRARRREDLERLHRLTGEFPIIASQDSDYPVRMFVPRPVFARALARYIEEMDYSSFTEATERKLGRERQKVNKEAWAAFAQLDEREGERARVPKILREIEAEAWADTPARRRFVEELGAAMGRGEA